MSSLITPEKILEMQEFLKQHPPDPAYDWSDYTLDAVIPPDEFIARCYRDALTSLGELPNELK